MFCTEINVRARREIKFVYRNLKATNYYNYDNPLMHGGIPHVMYVTYFTINCRLNIVHQLGYLYVLVYCLCVCVCVCERERESVSQSVMGCFYIYCLAGPIRLSRCMMKYE